MNFDENIISVIVPCRNEAGYIQNFVDSVAAQVIGRSRTVEIIISDGCSDDGTVEILQMLSSLDPRIKLVNNPGRIVSTGLNRALEIVSGAFVVRMDVHTQYDVNYINNCVTLLETFPYSCVGGAWRACYSPSSIVSNGISIAFQNNILSGGARSRDLSYDGLVDTVYLGAWRTRFLMEIGGFDESLVRNQDDELNLRIIRHGGQIYQSSNIVSYYHVRDNFANLMKQFFQYGYWKAAILKKHRGVASPRHFLPSIFFMLFCFFVILSSVNANYAPAAFSFILFYIVTLGVVLSLESSFLSVKLLFTSMMAAALMHFSYGLGFIVGVMSFFLRLKLDQLLILRSLSR